MAGFGPGTAIWKLAFQLSPIMFVNGISGQFLGGMMPIIVYTEAVNFITGLISGTQNIELDNFFAHFQPLPGSTLLDLDLGRYPFANQAVAANATIQQPLTLSMPMRCPARNELSYFTKLAVMANLQQVVTQHASLGGTYTVITPSAIYTNGILKKLSDASDTSSQQPQNAFQWDFEFPLLTLNQAQSAQNSLMSKLTGGSQITGTPSWSGLGTTVGDPSSLAVSSVVPASSGLTASTIAPFSGPLDGGGV